MLSKGILFGALIILMAMVRPGNADDPNVELFKMMHESQMENHNRFQISPFEYLNGQVHLKTLVKVDSLNGSTWILNVVNDRTKGFEMTWEVLK